MADTPWDRLDDDVYKAWLLATPMTADDYNSTSILDRRNLLSLFNKEQQEQQQYQEVFEYVRQQKRDADFNKERQEQQQYQDVFEYVRQQKRDAETLVLSKVTSRAYLNVTNELGVHVTGAEWRVRPTGLPEMEPFTWFSSKEDSQENRDGYMSYLREKFDWPVGYSIDDCSEFKTLLNVPSLGHHKTSGNIDVILALQKDIDNSTIKQNIRVGIELKKVTNTGSHEHQVVLQHLAASILNKKKSVLTVMTDLCDRWHFYWFGGSEPGTLYKLVVRKRSDAKYLFEHMFDDPGAEAASFPTEFLTRGSWNMFQGSNLSKIEEKPSHDSCDKSEDDGPPDPRHSPKGDPKGSKRPPSDGRHEQSDKKGKNKDGLATGGQQAKGGAHDSMDIANELDLLDFVNEEEQVEITLRYYRDHVLPWALSTDQQEPHDKVQAEERHGLSVADLDIHNAASQLDAR